MSDDSQQHDLLLSRLADEFVDRLRQGERPSLTEYVTRHPELADELRNLLPTIAEIEQVKETIPPADFAPPIVRPLGQWGDLILRHEIGRGGMGIIYEAEQISLSRLVAVKVLPRSAVIDPTQRRRFEWEARAAGRLHHTNIVPVFGVGEHDGQSYYVMQLIDGQSLSELLHGAQQETTSSRHTRQSLGSSRSHTRQSVDSHVLANMATERTVPPPAQRRFEDDRNVVDWISQIADAVQCAHQQGILHRDIKPSNLMLDRDGHIWITDFGLAKFVDQQHETRTGNIVGTVRYLPPEAFSGRRDERGDIYSLGLTLYELLARRPAFEGSDHSQLLHQVTSAEPPRLDKRRPDLPRDLVTIVHKSIEREPEQRYASAAELADDLRRWLRDEPIRARRPSLLEQLARWRRRNPGVAALLALILLILIGVANVASIAAWRFNQLAEDRESARRDAVSSEQAAVRSEQVAVREGEVANRERTKADSARLTAEDNLIEANRQRERAEAALYDGHLAQAFMHYRANSFDKAVQALHDAAPSTGQTDRRGWEWHYLNTLFESQSLTLSGHRSGGRPGWISALAFHPHGQQLAVGTQAPNLLSSTPGMHSDLRVYDLASGECRHDFGGPSGQVLSVDRLRFADDGRRLDASTFNFKADRSKKSLRSWDLTSGQLVYQNDSADNWQLDGDGLARWSNTELTFADLPAPPTSNSSTDAATAAPKASWSISNTDVLAWRAVPNEPGQFWVLARDGNLSVWNSAMPQAPRAVGQLSLPSGGGNPFALFSPDGRIVALRRVRSDFVEFWNTATAQRLHIHRDVNRAEVLAWAFSADSRLFAYGGYSHAIHVLDTQRFEEQATFRSYRGPVSALAFHPDGRRLAGGDWTGTVKLWDVARLPEHAVVGSKQWPVDFAWQADADPPSVVIASIAGIPNGPINEVVLEAWDVADSRRLWSRVHPWANEVRLVPGRETMFDARGERVLHVNRRGKSAGVVDVRSGQRLPDLTGHQHPIRAIALSSDGQRAVTAAVDLNRPLRQQETELKVWDVGTGRVLFEQVVPGATQRLALSPDNRLLATAGTSRPRPAGATTTSYPLVVWNLETSAVLWQNTNNRAALADLTFRHDSQELATIDRDGLVTRWDARSGQPVLHWPSTDVVESLTYSPDGHRLAGASRAHATLWNPTTGHEVLVLPLPGSATGSAYIPRLHFSPDGDHLAATHSEGRVLIWKATHKSTPKSPK